MHLALWYGVLVCHQLVGGVYGGLSDSGLFDFRKLGPVSFHVVGESPCFFLYSVVMSYVNCGDDGQVV